MSAAPPPAPPPSNLAAVFATILHVALVIGASGVVALALDRDAIDYPDAGPILGPAMIAAGGLVVAVAARSTVRARRPWLGAVAGAVGAVAATIVVGAVGYAIVRGELVWLVLAAGHFALSPLAAITFVSAFVALTAAWSFARLPRAPREHTGEGAGE